MLEVENEKDCRECLEMGEIPKFYRTAKARKEAHQNKNPPEVTKIVEEKRQSAVKVSCRGKIN